MTVTGESSEGAHALSAVPRLDAHVTYIRPPRTSDLGRILIDLPSYFPLLRVLVWRIAIVRYLQSVLGIIWLFVQPVVTTLVIFFMFNIVNIKTSDGPNNGLFLLVGVVVWQFFSRGVQDATTSLVINRGILTKVYLPKIMFPLASVVAAWFDLIVMMVMVLAAFLLLGITLSDKLLLLPIFLVLISLTALAIGLVLSAVNALFRDVGFAITFALQIGMYITPVLYAARFVPEKWRPIYYLNPLSTLIEGVRWTMLPASPPPNLFYLAVNVSTVLVALAVALLIFQRLDSEIVDRI